MPPCGSRGVAAGCGTAAWGGATCAGCEGGARGGGAGLLGFVGLDWLLRPSDSGTSTAEIAAARLTERITLASLVSAVGTEHAYSPIPMVWT